MKFRVYLIYHLFSIALLAVCLFMPLLTIVEADGASMVMTNFTLTLPDGTHAPSTWALGVLLVITMIVMALAAFVSPFSNFSLQKRTAVLGMLLLVGYYLALVVTVWIVQGGLGFIPEIYAGFPFVAFLLQLLSFWATCKVEANALKKAMDFRLRD